MLPSLSATIFVAFSLLVSTPSVYAVARGLAWAVNDNYAPALGNLPKVSWLHHWAMGPVTTVSSKIEYVPEFWGPSQQSSWNQRVAEMNKKTPQHLLGFNEPDLSSQSNLDPTSAASLWMQQIHPWAAKGVKLGSPGIAYNLDWMSSFLSTLKSKGGHVDFIVLHWYGSWNDIASFKQYIQTAHSRFNMDIWVTEFGITSASKPTQQNVKDFMMQAFAWMDTQSYVARAAWFGCFEIGNPVDSYATAMNAFYNNGGSLRDLAYWYGYSSQPDRRSLSNNKLSLARRHSAIAAAREDADDGYDPTILPVYCDDICKLRAQFLNGTVDDSA